MSVTSTSTTTQSTPTATDYHTLTDHHAILNRLKANNGKNLITNNNYNSNGRHIDISNDDLHENSKIASSINCNTLTKLRSQPANMIVDNNNIPSSGGSSTVVAKSPSTATTIAGSGQQPTTTTTTTNVAMFVNNHHHYHHHHHQHHIHQHISINSNNSNSPSNNANANINNNSNVVVHSSQNGSSNSINNNNNNNNNNNSGGPINGSLTLRKSYQGTDPSNASFSSASVADSIQDDNMSDQCSLTQAGLEEYNSRSYYDQAVFHHQKQSSYAQSEGYHSYVSSSDSSSATPFLDRLRQESELLSRQSHHWSQNDLTNSTNNSSVSSSNVNNDNNSSESTSSTETLKWLGSMSDVSVASHATNSSAISGSVSSSSQLIVHSSRVRTPKRQNSESVLYMNDDQMSVTSDSASSMIVSNGKPTIYQQQNQHYHHHTQSPPVKTITPQSTGSGAIVEYQNNSSNNGSTSSPSSTSSSSSTVPNATSSTVTTVATAAATTSNPTSSTNSSYRNNHRLFPVSTYTEPVNGTTPTSDYQSKSQHHHHHHHQYQQLPSPQTHTQQQQQQQQSSQLQSQSQQPQPQQMPGIKISSSQSHNWQSVADRINDFERQQQHLSIHHHHAMQQQSVQKYTYIDPSKTHRVPNPTLKAFQKNAVQSYFERQQQQNSKENSKNSSYSSVSSLSSTSSSLNGINGNSGSGNHQQQHQRPQSLQLPATPKEVTMPQIRSSLPNDFGRSSISLKSPSAQQLLNTSLVIQQISDDSSSYAECGVPPPPPPRSRSLMPIRRSSSASDYAEFHEHFVNGKDKTSVIKEQLISTVSSPEKSSFNDCGVPPPPPPPRGRTSMPVRRTSSASEYAAVRDKTIQMRQNLSKDLLGPIIMGPIISVDDWVPERPPKNPHLRVPSPDLPPPPMQMMDNEGNLINQDEPLPPPPPEILRHIRQSSETDIKPPSPSRRNSFAGSPSRKAIYHSGSYDSPPIPKKPTSMEIMHSRPLSSLAQSHKAHKVILNGKLESPANLNGSHPPTPTMPSVHSANTPTFEQSSRANDIRMSVRKRAHNPNMHHATGMSSNASPEIKNGVNKQHIFNLKSPPPLKPRMPIAGQEMRASSVAINSKLRCNSKASYLPRQTRDKLNTTDPDHGSYKLTLTSNEDSINHNNTTSSYHHHDEILSAKCNNLPDVLPLGAKMQPSSPASSASSPRYGSNNNITTTPPHTAPALISASYPIKSMFHFQQPVTSHNHTIRHSTSSSSSPSSNNQPTYNVNHLSRSTSSPQSSSDSISPKYMSQSTIDLKKTHIIESANKHSPGKILSPAQSENNIYEKQTSPYSIKRDFHSIDGMRKLSLEERDCNEGRIVRAELVNTILSASPPKSEERTMITRKDSLRENIEKITQLQSKLMSAHLSENSLLGYSKPSSLASSTATLNSVAEKEISKIDNITRSPPKTLSPLQYSTSNKSSPVIIANSNSSSPCSDKASKSTTTTTTTTNTISEDDRISQMDSEVDGLKLMQRTEIVLRLNAPTSEAASQTDETLEDELVRIKYGECKNDLNKSTDGRSQPTTTTTRILTPRKPHPDEIDCDNFSKDFANQLTPTDKLHDILTPKIYKSTSDYITDLYNTSVSVSNNTARSVISKRDVGTSTPNSSSNNNNNNNNDKSIGCELDNETNSVPTTASNTPTLETPDSGYYSVIEPKPKMVTKSSLKDGGGDVIVNGDSCDLIKKKEELVNRLTKKLTVLGNEQTIIAEESSVNDALGSDLTTKIAEKVRPIDATKFRTYVDDVGHITMLLLSLSGRLAKAENTLHSLEENHEEKKILEVKRNRLLEQLEEAKRLKEDIDRRGTVVGKILEKHLSIDEYADYDYFINMKAKLIVDSREIADKIKISEEQLIAIKDTLVQSDC